MNDEKLSGVQKLMTKGSPDLRARMEAESRTWMVQCARCGFERSVWETGGVRYKAAGTSRQYMRCPQCGKGSWHKVYRRKDEPGADPTSSLLSSLAPPVVAHSRTLPWGLIGLIAGFIAVLVTVILLIVLPLVFTLTQPVVTSGDNFMTALKTGDYAQAYALCTPDLQKELGGVSGLSALVRNERVAQWNWTSRSIRNGVGRVDGSFTNADGKTGDVHLVYSQVNNDWKITSFSFDPN